MIARLPYDICRCKGSNCDRRAECLRFVAFEDVGPATPWTERYCPDTGTTSEGFILAREEVEQ